MRLLSRSLLFITPVTAIFGPASAADDQMVKASFYGGSGERLSQHTANGAVFDPRGRTAAHRSLPFGTRVEVKYKGRSVVVRINDRGPLASTGSALDLSRGAASELGMTGTAPVSMRVVQ
jgi:rare lipoprotein A